jgi:hypothetical protein
VWFCGVHQPETAPFMRNFYDKCNARDHKTRDPRHKKIQKPLNFLNSET